LIIPGSGSQIQEFQSSSYSRATIV
jgi:hypothetical protein